MERTCPQRLSYNAVTVHVPFRGSITGSTTRVSLCLCARVYYKALMNRVKCTVADNMLAADLYWHHIFCWRHMPALYQSPLGLQRRASSAIVYQSKHVELPVVVTPCGRRGAESHFLNVSTLPISHRPQQLKHFPACLFSCQFSPYVLTLAPWWHETLVVVLNLL